MLHRQKNRFLSNTFQPHNVNVPAKERILNMKKIIKLMEIMNEHELLRTRTEHKRTEIRENEIFICVNSTFAAAIAAVQQTGTLIHLETDPHASVARNVVEYVITMVDDAVAIGELKRRPKCMRTYVFNTPRMKLVPGVLYFFGRVNGIIKRVPNPEEFEKNVIR